MTCPACKTKMCCEDKRYQCPECRGEFFTADQVYQEDDEMTPEWFRSIQKYTKALRNEEKLRGNEKRDQRLADGLSAMDLI